MKNLYLLGFLGLFIISSKTVSAQEPIPVKQVILDKPLLFTQFSDKTACNKLELEQLLLTAISENINLTVGNDIVLKGVLVEKIRRANHVYSINIKLNAYPGALLNLSFVMKELEITAIKGRIIHPHYGDVLVLIEENQQYYFIKQNQKYFMTE
jgi:hypothetical protein